MAEDAAEPAAAEVAPEVATEADAGTEAAVAQQEECIRRGSALLRGLFAPRYKPAATFDEMDEARLCHVCLEGLQCG